MGLSERRVLAIVATDATFARRTVDGAAAWVGKCIACGRALVVGADGRIRSHATVEHIWPRHHGGDDALANLALACAGCNHEKGRRHDHKRRDDPKLAAVAGELARRRRERWRDPDDVGLGELVRRFDPGTAPPA